jgi:hypothetical protein
MIVCTFIKDHIEISFLLEYSCACTNPERHDKKCPFKEFAVVQSHLYKSNPGCSFSKSYTNSVYKGRRVFNRRFKTDIQLSYSHR